MHGCEARRRKVPEYLGRQKGPKRRRKVTSLSDTLGGGDLSWMKLIAHLVRSLLVDCGDRGSCSARALSSLARFTRSTA